MYRTACRVLLGIIPLMMCACATQFGGGRIEKDQLYTARSFLTGTCAEQMGYALYSYLLFPAPPTSEKKEFYEAAVRAFLAYPPAPASEALLPRDTLNIFYLLLMDKPPPEVTRCLRSNCYPVSDAAVDWILGHYNYARAQIMLRQVSSKEYRRPCIVTVSDPLSILSAGQIPKKESNALIQYLSNASPSLVRAWVELFIKTATGENSGFKQNMRALMLHIYTAADSYARGLPKVLRAFQTIVSSVPDLS